MSNDTPQPVLIMNSVLAGLGVILAGAALLDYLPLKLVGLLVLVHAGVTLGWGTYVKGRVFPNERVAVVALPPREVDGVRLPAALVTGPALGDDKASPLVTGEPVDVTAAGPSPYGRGTETVVPEL